MSTESNAVEVDPTYIAGLFDAIGRVRFDISDTEEGKYTVRPMLRFRPHGTELRAAVVGEFLDEHGYQYDYVERDYGEEFFRIQQRSDLQNLQSFLEGQSAQLVRELKFVNGVFADEFDSNILDPLDIYRFTITRDTLRYGWRPRGRFHISPSEIADKHNIDVEQVEPASLPEGGLRSDYAVEWVAGVYDGLCRYRPSIAKSSESEIGYVMSPVARLHRSGITEEFVNNILRFCDDYDLSYGDSSQQNELRVVFTGPSNIRRILDVLFPRLLVLAEASEILVESILPRFDAEEHHHKQGFYDLLRDFDLVADASGGPFKQRDYNPAYFADQWRTDLELIEEETQGDQGEYSQETVLEKLEDVRLSPDTFGESPGRYQTIIDRVQRDSGQVAELKSLYDDRCQVCDARLANRDGTGYSEVHHIRPLGGPHDGPDDPGNMIVLCPNHHADFDNGVIRIHLDDLSIEHPYDSDVDGHPLSVDPDHEIDEGYFHYHNKNICRLR